jgi:hypothetical protein
VNEQVDNAEYEFLWKLLANPAEPNHSYIFNLQSLVNDYPQSGVLRALLMPNGDKRHVKHAAAYFNPRVLHKLSTAPASLATVTADQIVFSDGPEPIVADTYLNIPATEPFAPSAEMTVVDDIVESTAEEIPYNTFSLPEPEPIVDPERESVPAYIEDEPEATSTSIEDDPVHEEIAEAPIIEQTEETETPAAFEEATTQPVIEEDSLAKQYDTYLAESEAAPVSPVSSYEEGGDRYFHQAIDDEVYDEIVSIEDIGLEQLAILNKSVNDDEAVENYFVFEPETAEPEQETPRSVVTEAVAENTVPAQTDWHPAVINEEPVAQQHAYTLADEKSNVSKYNDEKMPYTFMWWLDKTRKEHADAYQPYANRSAPAERPKQKEVVDELQQQYYQNIVSTTSITELDKNPPKAPAAPLQRKEDKIIERFIHEEPHIKHPTGAKLDNENKAKRSSEDKEELVTETLARIYTEQMLYHKAILTYKKLMLKYPEKSLYFAGQIEQLEIKIN